MELQTIIELKELVKIFAAAVKEKNFDRIDSLLADDGGFQTQDALLETVEHCSKSAFMEWFRTELSEISIDKIEYDNCILCKMGAPVVIFNDGQFPKVKLDSSRKSMNGLMLDIEEGLIKNISICYAYAVRENKYQYECDGERVNELMKEYPEMPLKEAINVILTRRGYRDL